MTWRSRVLRHLLRSGVRPLFLRGGVDDWRRRWPAWPAPRGVRVERARGGLAAEWLIPTMPGHAVLYYVHGGGFVMGSPGTYRRMIGRLAAAARARAFVIDYRLAPENPFPAALQDALAGFRWLVAHGVRPRDVVVVGDSAGGCLALSMLVMLRDAGERLPAGIVCLSAATDLTLEAESHRTRVGDEVLLTPDFCRSVAAAYRCEGVEPSDPLASPLFADLHGLPPLLVHVGTHELFLDDSLRLADKASAAGVEVTLKVWEGMWHVFHLFGWLPETREAIAEIAAFAQRCVARRRRRRSSPTRARRMS